MDLTAPNSQAEGSLLKKNDSHGFTLEAWILRQSDECCVLCVSISDNKVPKGPVSMGAKAATPECKVPTWGSASLSDREHCFLQSINSVSSITLIELIKISQGSLSCFSAPGALIELLLSIYYIGGNRLREEGNGWEVGSKDEDGGVPLCWSKGMCVLDNVFWFLDTLN